MHSRATVARVAIAFCSFLLVSIPVWAEHEADHRYNIRGYVLDEDERGIANVSVSAFSEREPLGSASTDAQGAFSLHLHLHNSDLGRELTLRAGEKESRIKVSFDPADNRTQRVHEVSFVGDRVVEGSLGRFAIPTIAYVVAGLVALGVGVVMLESRRKKRLRQARAEVAETREVAQPRRRKSRRKRR